MGDGAAELRHILLLSPDVLRIDPELVQGLADDVRRRVLVESIATGKPVGATVHDALSAARVVDAMITSSDEKKWVRL